MGVLAFYYLFNFKIGLGNLPFCLYLLCRTICQHKQNYIFLFLFLNTFLCVHFPQLVRAHFDRSGRADGNARRLFAFHSAVPSVARLPGRSFRGDHVHGANHVRSHRVEV